MNYQIDRVDAAEYPDVLAVWEASVRATHHFLQEADIQFYKPLLVNEYLKAVELACVRNETGKIVGFMGIADDRIEMLFIHPDVRGQGIGKVLLNHALSHLGMTKVDVNEANEQAVGFYRHAGFRTVSRSETDASGQPLPILHMALVKA